MHSSVAEAFEFVSGTTVKPLEVLSTPLLSFASPESLLSLHSFGDTVFR